MRSDNSAHESTPRSPAGYRQMPDAQTRVPGRLPRSREARHDHAQPGGIQKNAVCVPATCGVAAMITGGTAMIACGRALADSPANGATPLQAAAPVTQLAAPQTATKAVQQPQPSAAPAAAQAAKPAAQAVAQPAQPAAQTVTQAAEPAAKVAYPSRCAGIPP